MINRIRKMSEIREQTKKILSEILNDNCYTDLEKGIFNFSILKCKEIDEKPSYSNKVFVDIYKEKLKQICSKLIIPNGHIKENLVKDNEPHRYAFMTDFELDPLKYSQYKSNIPIEEDKVNIATTMFKCEKCGESNCEYYEMQTRSADESATSFISCLNCGNKWKE